ncbi:hypothetical protein ACLOJK_016150 [Asimina triloba]
MELPHDSGKMDVSHNVHWRSVPLDGLSPGIVRDELGEMRIQDKKTGEREAAMGWISN